MGLACDENAVLYIYYLNGGIEGPQHQPGNRNVKICTNSHLRSENFLMILDIPTMFKLPRPQVFFTSTPHSPLSLYFRNTITHATPPKIRSETMNHKPYLTHPIPKERGPRPKNLKKRKEAWKRRDLSFYSNANTRYDLPSTKPTHSPPSTIPSRIPPNPNQLRSHHLSSVLRACVSKCSRQHRRTIFRSETRLGR